LTPRSYAERVWYISDREGGRESLTQNEGSKLARASRSSRRRRIMRVGKTIMA